MDINKIKQILEVSREFNVKKITVNDNCLEVTFNDKITTELLPLKGLGIETERMPTEDEFLHMSGIPLTPEEIEAMPPKE